MIVTQDSFQTAYQALADGAALQRRPAAGLLVLTGADRSDFLHRMTTNDINALKPGHSTVTILTSPTARILFVFTVVCRSDELWLLPADGEASLLARHLRGQIFFMDKVTVRDAGESIVRARLMGPQAGAVLAQLGLKLDDTQEGAWQADPATGLVAIGQQAYDVPGYELILEKDRAEETFVDIAAAGAVLLDETMAYDAHRIALGRPAPGHELTGDYNPLEAGMAWVCADNKGCYTGQEIIARQITYDKVTKRLVGLQSSQLLQAGAAITVNGQVVGAVTSAAFDQAHGAPLALGIVKRPHHTPGALVVCGDAPAEVVDLPFRKILDS
jgi:folate-binding protein YgfZ